MDNSKRLHVNYTVTDSMFWIEVNPEDANIFLFKGWIIAVNKNYSATTGKYIRAKIGTEEGNLEISALCHSIESFQKCLVSSNNFVKMLKNRETKYRQMKEDDQLSVL